MKEFKIRCSKIGQIMAKPKSGNLSIGAKTYCQKWLIEQITGKKKIIVADTLYKGDYCENDAINLIVEYLKIGLLVKNDLYFENDFMCGTPDIIHGKELVIDIKCPIDHETFPYFEDEVNKDYFYQGQGYMNLTGINKFCLAYCLMDTPDKIINSKLRQINYLSDEGSSIFDDFMLSENMRYSDFPDKLRVKTYNFEYDPEVIKQVNEKVVYCREYIKTLIKKLNV